MDPSRPNPTSDGRSRLLLEPGRALVEHAVFLLTTVTAVKRLPSGAKAAVLGSVPRERLSAPIGAGTTALYCDRCQGLLKGGSVLFGEEVEAGRLDAARRALLGSDLLLVLGTSLALAPAADLLRWAREAGIPVAIVNATPTPWDGHATATVTADVGAVMLDLLRWVTRSRASRFRRL